MIQDYYNAVSVGQNTYRLVSSDGVVFDLFVGSKKALLFDTGHGFGDIRAAVRKITDLPITVVNSHGHIDHTGGNYQFSDCEIYMHPGENQLLRNHNTHNMRNGVVQRAKRSYDFRTKEYVNILPKGFDEDAYISAQNGRTMPVNEGRVFDLGGIQLETLHFRGHTKGGIALWNKAARTLYTADAISVFVWLFLPESDPLSMYVQSIEKALALDFDRFYVGHGSKGYSKYTLEYILEVAQSVRHSEGQPFHTPLVPDVTDARIYVREGYEANDFKREGFAAVAITPDKI